MTESRETLASSITSEITRVSAKRERWRERGLVAGTMGNMRPALYIMDQAIHFGREARDSGAVDDMARALENLRAVEND